MHGEEGNNLFVIYFIADRLHKFAHEVLQMSQSELYGWLAYIEHKNKLEKHHGS